MGRQVFHSTRWQALVMALLGLAFGLLLPILAVFDIRPVGLWLVILLPVVLIPTSCWLVWHGLIRAPRLELDETGLAVVQGSRRFALPWSGVRRVASLPRGVRGADPALLVAWPVERPPPGSPVDQSYTPAIGAYVLFIRANLATSDDELASAVQRYAPGRWGIPED